MPRVRVYVYITQYSLEKGGRWETARERKRRGKWEELEEGEGEGREKRGGSG